MQDNSSDSPSAFSSLRIQMEIEFFDEILPNCPKLEGTRNLKSKIETNKVAVFKQQRTICKNRRSKGLKQEVKNPSLGRKMSDIVIETINKFIHSHSSTSHLDSSISFGEQNKENILC